MWKKRSREGRVGRGGRRGARRGTRRGARRVRGGSGRRVGKQIEGRIREARRVREGKGSVGREQR